MQYIYSQNKNHALSPKHRLWSSVCVIHYAWWNLAWSYWWLMYTFVRRRALLAARNNVEASYSNGLRWLSVHHTQISPKLSEIDLLLLGNGFPIQNLHRDSWSKVGFCHFGCFRVGTSPVRTEMVQWMSWYGSVGTDSHQSAPTGHRCGPAIVTSLNRRYLVIYMPCIDFKMAA